MTKILVYDWLQVTGHPTKILVSDWLLTSHVTSILVSDSLITCHVTKILVSDWLIISHVTKILVCDWLLTSHVTKILVSDWLITRIERSLRRKKKKVRATLHPLIPDAIVVVDRYWIAGTMIPAMTRQRQQVVLPR